MGEGGIISYVTTILDFKLFTVNSAGSCEHGNETSGSIKGGECLD
jgi:hypothetical protein